MSWRFSDLSTLKETPLDFESPAKCPSVGSTRVGLSLEMNDRREGVRVQCYSLQAHGTNRAQGAYSRDEADSSTRVSVTSKEISAAHLKRHGNRSATLPSITAFISNSHSEFG